MKHQNGVGILAFGVVATLLTGCGSKLKGGDPVAGQGDSNPRPPASEFESQVAENCMRTINVAASSMEEFAELKGPHWTNHVTYNRGPGTPDLVSMNSHSVNQEIPAQCLTVSKLLVGLPFGDANNTYPDIEIIQDLDVAQLPISSAEIDAAESVPVETKGAKFKMTFWTPSTTSAGTYEGVGTTVEVPAQITCTEPFRLQRMADNGRGNPADRYKIVHPESCEFIARGISIQQLGLSVTFSVAGRGHKVDGKFQLEYARIQVL